MGFNVGTGFGVKREDPVLGTGLNSHVRHSEAVRHGQVTHSLPTEFHRTIKRSIDPDHPDDREDEVFSTHPGPRLTDELEPDGGRNLEPARSGKHSCCEVRAPHPGGKGRQCPIGAGMAIRAHNEITGHDQTFFGQQHVLDPHLSHIVKMDDAHFPGKSPRFGHIRCGYSLCGRQQRHLPRRLCRWDSASGSRITAFTF